MSNEKLAVVLPTVKGREVALGRAIASLRDAPLSYTFIIHDRDTCGEAWNEGVNLALYRPELTHILLFADDLYAVDKDWFYAGAVTLGLGEIPCPILLEPGTGKVWNEGDGEAGNQYAFSRVPMLTVEMARQIFPVPPLHYYSDCWIGSKATSLGIDSRVTGGYAFYHGWSQEGRKTDSDSERDRALYEWESGRL